MKNTLKLIGIIALLAIIGFSMAGCDNGSTPKKVAVTGVKVSPETLTLQVGKTETLIAEVEPDNATKKNVTWSSSAPAVATVANGVVTAVAPGNATITVTTEDGGKTADCFVTVVAALPPGSILVASVTLSPATLALVAGTTGTLTATVLPNDAADKSLTWSSSHPAVASVDKDGVVSALAAGTATITAKAVYGATDDAEGTCEVTVTAPVGSGQYTKKDVLGNTYSISIGNSIPASSIAARYARAAVQNDRVRMSVTGRDGKTRNVSGKVKKIGTDGTLTLETDGGVEFTAVVSDTTMESVASESVEIPFDDGTKLIPRTFDNILLRVDRWSTNNEDDPSTGPMHGEHWGSGKSVLVKDFPTNVSKLEKNTTDRYTITVSGTVDKDLDRVEIEVQGLTANDEWKYLGGYDKGVKISANVPFSQTFDINTSNYNSVSYNLMDYKEIILQFTNVRKKIFDNHLDWDNVDLGSIPADIPDGQIMATISNFNIVLKDKNRDKFKGNTNDYTYGFKEDGFSVNYNLAVWSLTNQNIIDAKKPNAKFEFIMMDLEDIFDPGTSLYFAWQDPVRGLWWQDSSDISEWNASEDWHLTNASWDGWRKKITINISDVIKDSKFAASTQLNFIIGCWWKDGEECANINDLTITGANIYSLPTCAGNMGDYIHGYEEDGISINYQSMMWNLSEAVLATAQDPGARLDIVFSKDLGDHTGIGLVWEDAGTERWWPEGAERGTPVGDNDMPNVYVYRNEPSKNGVYYDTQTKRLSVVLDTALETYNDSDANSGKIGFESATDAAILIYCWWNEKGGGDNVDITDLGILSANIVSGSSASAEKPVTIMLYANGEWGWQEKDYYPASLFNGMKITKDEEYTLNYSFKSNVAMDKFQVVLVDNGENTGGTGKWGWIELSDYIEVKTGITANTVYTGSVTIKAKETATDNSPESNRLILQAGAGTKSLPTLTFTALSITK